MIITDNRGRIRNVVESACPDCGKIRIIRTQQVKEGKLLCHKCAAIRRCLNPAYIEKISRGHMGKTASAETRKKMSEAMKMKPPESWQKNLSAMREAHMRDRTEASCLWLYAAYKRSAKKRNIDFEITLDEFVNITRQNCHYCGIEPNNFIKDHLERLNGAYVFNGIDRVNNDIGYTVDNSVPCCKTCNYAKRKMTEDDFLDWVIRVYNHSCGAHVPLETLGSRTISDK